MMRKFIVSYRNTFLDIFKSETVYLWEESCENLKEGNLAIKIIEEIQHIERVSGIILINFWEIYDKT